MDREADAVRARGGAKVVHFQQRFGGGVLLLGIVIFHIGADHHAHDGRQADLGRRPGADQPAILHHRDAIRQPNDLIEAV